MKDYKVKVLSPINGEMDIIISKYKKLPPAVGSIIPITLVNHDVEVLSVEEIFHEKMNSTNYIWEYLHWLCDLMEDKGWTVTNNQGFGFKLEKDNYKFSLFGYDSLNKWFSLSVGNKDIIRGEIISLETTTQSILDVLDFYMGLEYHKIDTYKLLTDREDQFFYQNIKVVPYETDPNRF